jgi:predicted O-methyltransferase YrrM
MASQVDISKAISIDGWMSKRELTWLANTSAKCNTIVEFGSYKGRSCRAMADNTDGIIWAVDPWSDEVIPGVTADVLSEFKANLSDHIKSGKVIPVQEVSEKFSLDKSVDMVFIDADHNYDHVTQDIINAMSLVKPNGIISGHDYGCPDWPDVALAVNNLFNNIEVEDSIWWIVRS